jgi:ParB family chromosome partitioning protein
VAIRRGLGKGLSALLPAENERPILQTQDNSVGENSLYDSLPDASESGGAAGVSGGGSSAGNNRGEILLPLEKIIANPNQPRKTFGEDELNELADSIRQQGVIQPILVEDAGDGTFTIIAGERRTRAARLAGLSQIPAILRKYSEEKRMVVTLVENIQRSDLNPVEEAAAYRQLMELENLSQEEVAAKVGKNRATVANALRLLKLPADMQESMKRGELSAGHARAVLSVSGEREQDLLFREILKKGLSVREAEKRAAALSSDSKKTQKSVPKNARSLELDAMQEKFIERLGTKVVINGDLEKGTIVVDYYSMEDLDRLYEILGGR